MINKPTPFMLYEIRATDDPETCHRACYAPKRAEVRNRFSGWIEPVSNLNVEPFIGQVLEHRPLFVVTRYQGMIQIKTVLSKQDVKTWKNAREETGATMIKNPAGNITLQVKPEGVDHLLIYLKSVRWRYVPELAAAVLKLFTQEKYH